MNAAKRVNKNKITLKSLWTILKKTVEGFSEDRVTRLSAALSYVTIFSFAPFILVIINIGAFFAQDVEGTLFEQLSWCQKGIFHHEWNMKDYMSLSLYI